MGTHHKRLIKELLEGKKMATELQILLHKPFGDRGSVSAEELVMKIMSTFSESLSVLTGENNNSCDGASDDLQSGAFGEVYQIKPEPSHLDHSHCDERSSEDSGESRKTQAFKDRRGCYKRRKTSQSWTVVSATIDDGQAWRKYGQKEILNALYPRAYFRCTRKYDQGCKATKQVQQVQDSPRTYQTTYIGHHTCRSIVKAPPMILASDPWESQTVSSESGTPNHQNHHLFGQSPSIPNVKQEEHYKEGTPSDLTDNISSMETENMWPDFKDHFNHSMAFQAPLQEGSQPAVCASSKMGSDEDFHFVVKSINFEEDFDFNEAEFPIDVSL